MCVEIATGLLAELAALAAADPDREVCGILYGTANRVDGYRIAVNVAADARTAFEIDPATLLAAYRAMRTGGPPIAGCYHSHPSGAPTPSPRDVAGAEPGQLWLILAGAGMRLYSMETDGLFTERAIRQT